MVEDHFAGDVAARYDERLGAMGDPEVVGRTVDVLAELADGGRACEFAVGTGRIAVPLAARGVPVSGIDLSPDMVTRLSNKPGGAHVDVTIGDMVDTRVAGEFRLVYLVYNTIGNVRTQRRQTAVFANAASHLEPGGCFLVEVGVPDLRRLVPGSDVVVVAHEPGYLGYDHYDDLVAQHAVSHHVRTNDVGVDVTTTPFRFVWPSELDLMAQLAGLQLAHRWADWDRSGFTAASTKHVSVWRRPTVVDDERTSERSVERAGAGTDSEAAHRPIASTS